MYRGCVSSSVNKDKKQNTIFLGSLNGAYHLLPHLKHKLKPKLITSNVKSSPWGWVVEEG